MHKVFNLDEDEDKQMLVRRSGIPLESFLKLVTKIELEKFGRIAHKMESPVCITKFPHKESFKGNKLVDTWATFRSKVHKGLNGGCVVQRFIHPTSSSPRITRVVFYNPLYRKKPNKVNYALAIVNKLDSNSDQSNHYRWCVNIEVPHSVRIEKIVGKAVDDYLPYMQSILEFVLRAFKIRLKCVVADFIKDSNGTIWFIDLKSFKVPKSLYSIYCELPESAGPKQKLQDKMKSYAKCRLCNMKHGKEELQQLLTMNMIIEYKKHLNQRGIFEFDHVDKYKKSEGGCFVCDLCNSLIVAELQLKQVAKRMAIAQNIPIYVKENKEPIIKGEVVKMEYLQWRLFFYFNKLIDVIPSQLKEKYDSLYLHLKLFDYITTITLWCKPGGGSSSPRFSPKQRLVFNCSGSPKFDSTPELLINKLRVHYFFTCDEQIETLLKDTKINLRLTTGPAWNSNVIASANAFALKGLNEKLTDTAQKAEYMAALFVESTPQLFGYLRIIVGVTKDSPIMLQNVLLTKFNGVYFPYNSYHNVQQLPDTWLNIFEENVKYYVNDGPKEVNYTPVCTKSEISMVKAGSTCGINNGINIGPSRPVSAFMRKGSAPNSLYADSRPTTGFSSARAFSGTEEQINVKKVDFTKALFTPERKRTGKFLRKEIKSELIEELKNGVIKDIKGKRRGSTGLISPSLLRIKHKGKIF